LKKVYLEELPRRGEKQIDWNNSIGQKIKFIYDDIEGEIKVVNYEKNNNLLHLKYLNDDIFYIKTSHFYKCSIGKLIGKRTIEFKAEIGQVFKDKKRDIIIVGREYRQRIKNTGYIEKEKYYQYKCNKCGWSDNRSWIIESSLFHGIGCSCCSIAPKTLVQGINDITTSAPWMVKFFQGGYDEAKLYTKSNGHKIIPICPDCGKVKEKPIAISHIYNDKSIGCSCGDNYSYPNKFMLNLLEQLNIEFESEYNPEWIKPKRFDFYFKLNDKEYIVEMDGGLGHGEKNRLNGQSAKDSQAIDNMKDMKADEHGIKVIRIDSKKSELEYIKNNIIIKLNNILKLNKIDWLQCEEFALRNLVKVACNYKKENNDLTTKDIGKLMKVDRSTIWSYLKKGSKLGWCDYNPKEETDRNNLKAGSRNRIHSSKPVEIFKDNMSLGKFESSAELERQSEKLFGVKLGNTAISSVCLNKYKYHKGYTFMFI